MKPIANYEKRYLISDTGNILNLANNTFLKPIENKNGYLKVGLANGDGTHKQKSIHSLVALHFIPNPYKYTQINHKDGNKKNNIYTNLEWCTQQENIQHAFRTGLRPGYMSADDKEKYLFLVLNGMSVKDLSVEINRRPETLHKMLRDTATRINRREEWDIVMRRNRKNVAITNLKKINDQYPK